MSERAPMVRLAVVLPQERGRERPLLEHVERVVLARLVLVPHHRHLRLEVLLGDEAVDHPVGLEVERPGEVRVRGGEGLEVVGAVVPGGAVGLRAVLGQLLRDVGMLRRALERQVLEQVRHPGLAVAFVPGADEIGDVDRDGRLRGVGEEQDAEPVREVVFGDALDRGAAHGGRDGRCGPRRRRAVRRCAAGCWAARGTARASRNNARGARTMTSGSGAGTATAGEPVRRTPQY